MSLGTDARACDGARTSQISYGAHILALTFTDIIAKCTQAGFGK